MRENLPHRITKRELHCAFETLVDEFGASFLLLGLVSGSFTPFADAASMTYGVDGQQARVMCRQARGEDRSRVQKRH